MHGSRPARPRQSVGDRREAEPVPPRRVQRSRRGDRPLAATLQRPDHRTSRLSEAIDHPVRLRRTPRMSHDGPLARAVAAAATSVNDRSPNRVVMLMRVSRVLHEPIRRFRALPGLSVMVQTCLYDSTHSVCFRRPEHRSPLTPSRAPGRLLSRRRLLHSKDERVSAGVAPTANTAGRSRGRRRGPDRCRGPGGRVRLELVQEPDRAVCVGGHRPALFRTR